MSAFRLLCALVLTVTGLGIADPAAAQTISAGNPNAIASVVREKGYQATITKDDEGDPMIKVEGKGYSYVILFYGCTDNVDCTSLGLASYVPGSSSDLERVNKWNHDNRFGRAYLDEGDPVVEMDIDMEGGISRTLFSSLIDKWNSVVSSFSKAMVD